MKRLLHIAKFQLNSFFHKNRILIGTEDQYSSLIDNMSSLYLNEEYSSIIEILEGDIFVKGRIESDFLLLKSYLSLNNLSGVKKYWLKCSQNHSISVNADFLQTTRVIIKVFINHSEFRGEKFIYQLIDYLINQSDDGDLFKYPILCSLLFELHEYDRYSFNFLYECIKSHMDISPISIDKISLNVSVLLITFNLIGEDKRRYLIEKYFLKYDVRFHWSYLLIGKAYNEKWDDSLKMSLNNFKIIDDIFKDLNATPHSLSPTSLYNMLLVSSVFNREVFLDLLLIGQAMLRRSVYFILNRKLDVLNDLSSIINNFSRPNNQYQKKSRLKIAVCISGQMRGWRRALESWSKGVFAGHDVQYFVHTWKDSGSSFPVPPKDERSLPRRMFDTYRELWNIFGYDEMVCRYPTFFKLWDYHSIYVSEDVLRSAFDTQYVIVEDDSASQFACMTNAEKMYYKISKCQQLFDSANMDDVDLIVRLRPDFELLPGAQIKWLEIYEDCVSRNTIYCDSYPRYFFPNIGFCISDQIAVGTIEAIRAYSSAYDLTRKSNFQYFPTDYIAHTNVAYSTFYSGYDISALPLPCTLAPLKRPNDEDIKRALMSDISDRMDSYDLKLIKCLS